MFHHRARLCVVCVIVGGVEYELMIGPVPMWNVSESICYFTCKDIYSPVYTRPLVQIRIQIRYIEGLPNLGSNLD